MMISQSGYTLPVPAPVVLFDLDGTLIHSVPDLTVATNACLSEDNRRLLTESEVSQMVGNGLRILVKRAYAATGDPLEDGERLEAVVSRFNAWYMKAPTALTRPFPGVEETLEELLCAGCLMGVVTNKPIEPVRAILDQLGMTRFFPVILGGGSVPHLKPHPEPLLAALDLFCAPDRWAIFVGDSLNDTEAARHAGLPCIALTYGYRRCSAQELGADVLIDRFSDLPKAICQILV